MKLLQQRLAGTTILLLLVIAVIAGCQGESEDQAKQDALDALSKQQQVDSEQFQGELQLQLNDLPFDVSTQPYTSMLLNPLADNGTISWSGISDRKQGRMEADIRFSSNDGDSVMNFPIIQSEQTLYFHVPLINKDEEYFTLPLTKPYANAGQTLYTAFSKWIEGMEPAWFTTAPNDDKGKTITLTIKPEQWAEFLNATGEAIPNILQELKNGGLLAQTQIDEWQALWIEFAKISDQSLQAAEGAPVQATIATNEQGFITHLDFTIQVEQMHARMTQTWEAMNASQEFTKPVPESTVSFTEVLKFIQPQ